MKSMDNHCQTQKREITPKVRKAELSFLYMTHRLVLFYVSTKYHQNTMYTIFQRVFDLQSRHKINGLSPSNITKGDNAKSKKGRVVNLVCDTSSGPVLHFCQVPSKYSKGYSSYSADKKSISNKTKGDNSKIKKARVVILVCDMPSGLVLHFYQVS